MRMTTSNVNLFEYEDYRNYLRRLYEAKKEVRPTFSYRVFARMAGFRSSNFLHLVISGKRNLSADSTERLIQALKLSKQESRCFRYMVQFNQAKTVEEKNHYAEQLMSVRQYRKVHPLREVQYRYLTNWYYVAIRELVATKGFVEDPHWIAKKLEPSITPQEAARAIQELFTLGLLSRNEKGRVIQSDSVLSTGDEVSASVVAKFHRSMIEKASESIDRIQPERREISSVTVSVSKDTALEMKKMIQGFRKKLLELASREGEVPDSVYQLNFQLFPLMKEEEESE